MNILVTGGAGYIGSHSCVQILDAGHTLTVLDNLSNSSSKSAERISEITGSKLNLVIGNILDSSLLNELFSKESFDAVIHFAGLKSISESIVNPLAYFQTNVAGTVSLLQSMKNAAVKNLVFSSTAAVYGEPSCLPISEDAQAVPVNPYGESKLIVEKILAATHRSDPDWRIAVLRYFNPVGAHPSGLIGEDPRNTPSNLLPICIDAALGLRDDLPVFGGDYPTSDGTGVRDFIHVMDLADGHVSALAYLMSQPGGVCSTFNLGTGKGISVREMIRALEEASQVTLPWRIVPRRSGDVAACYADASRARDVLGWRAQLGLKEMCRDAWLWRQMNPTGFDSETPARK